MRLNSPIYQNQPATSFKATVKIADNVKRLLLQPGETVHSDAFIARGHELERLVLSKLNAPHNIEVRAISQHKRTEGIVKLGVLIHDLYKFKFRRPIDGPKDEVECRMFYTGPLDREEHPHSWAKTPWGTSGIKGKPTKEDIRLLRANGLHVDWGIRAFGGFKAHNDLKQLAKDLVTEAMDLFSAHFNIVNGDVLMPEKDVSCIQSGGQT